MFQVSCSSSLYHLHHINWGKKTTTLQPPPSRFFLSLMPLGASPHRRHALKTIHTRPLQIQTEIHLLSSAPLSSFFFSPTPGPLPTDRRTLQRKDVAIATRQGKKKLQKKRMHSEEEEGVKKEGIRRDGERWEHEDSIS